MTRFKTAAAALILISAGGFLVFRGVHGYVVSQNEQFQFARDWRAPTGRRGSQPSIESPVPGTLNVRYGDPFSHLEIPRLHTSLYVVEGSDENSLRKGPGHLHGSAMPGQHGNCVIAGHRDLHFRALKDIHPGDQVLLETAQGKFSYRVTGTKIITQQQLEVLQPTPDAELHLITCYPFYFLGHAPKRFVVTAQLDSPVPMENASAQFAIPSRANRNPVHRPVKAAVAAVHSRPRHTAPRYELSAYERSLRATRALNRAAAGTGE